jgi:hypothetical protein
VRAYFSLGLALIGASSSAAIGQADAAATAAADAQSAAGCELHAWPAGSLRSTYHGWFHGGINDGAVQGRDGYELLPPDPLSTAEQIARLRAIPLAEILTLPGYRVVVHDEPLSSSAIRRATGRHVADSPACYAELVTDDVFFQEDIVDGRFLKVLFRFRSFDGSDAPARTFGTYSQRRLTLFPPKEQALESASFTELGEQYAEAIGEFGRALNPPPKEPKKSARRARN